MAGLSRRDRFELPEPMRRLFEGDWEVPAFRVEEFRDANVMVVRAELPSIDPEKDLDVTVTDGELTINKITAAIDCGRVVNPSGAKQQVVGGIIWSLTALLYGGAPLKNGRIQHSNFHENRLLRMNECPPIEAHLMESAETRPLGLGEMSAPLAVPAVLNAIYAATGKRIRTIPIPQDLRSA